MIMKALRYFGPGKVEIEEIERPTLQAGEVLIRTAACGVCATDVKTVKRGHPKIKPGTVIGHEVSGVILDANGVEGWQAGDRVAAAPYAPCGVCPSCQRKQFTLCDHLMEEAFNPGGFAEYIALPPRIVQKGLFKVPASLSLELAALAEPLGCCLHALQVMDIQPQHSLLIIGDGPMGLMQAEAARALGVHQIILSGTIPMRLARAARIADAVIDASQEDVAARLQQLCPGGADMVLVSVGAAEVAESAFRCVYKGGTINLFAGLPGGTQISIDPYQIHYNEVRLLGSFGLAPQHFQQAIELMADGKVNMDGIVTATVPIGEVIEAINNVAEFRGIKSIVKFGEEELPIR
jgi:L-iditol 2-dehydrogenase